MTKADGGLRGIFKDQLPQVDWQAIETFVIGPGTPDANGCYLGTEFWMEYKQIHHWGVGLRPQQYAWAMRRIAHGGRVFCAVRRTVKNSDTDDLWIIPMIYGKELYDEGLRPFIIKRETWNIGYWQGGVKNWDWSAILQYITGRK